MASQRRTALAAGLLYLMIILGGPFILLYVPAQLYVTGDAAATTGRILAHVPLYRAHIIVGMVTELAFLGAVLALYRLLRGVHQEIAALMVILIVISVPLAFLEVANQLATLRFLRDPASLGAFSGAQRDAVTTMMILFDQRGIFVTELLWGSGSFRSACSYAAPDFCRDLWACGWS